MRRQIVAIKDGIETVANTQRELSKITGVPQGHISRVLAGRDGMKQAMGYTFKHGQEVVKTKRELGICKVNISQAHAHAIRELGFGNVSEFVRHLVDDKLEELKG